MTHNIIMPDLGQTVAEGKILRWLKKPGEPVARGEALLEVETDKVTMEVESYRSGYLRAILVGEGEMASAMSPVAVLTDRADEVFGNGALGDAAAPRSGSEDPDPSARVQVPSAPEAGLELQSQNQSGRVAATP